MIASGHARLEDSGRSDASRRTRTWWAPGVASLALVAALLTLADLGEVRALLRSVDGAHLALAVLLLTATNVFHASRLGVLLRDRVQTDWLARIVITLRYGFYVAVFPARLGEVAYVIRLRRDLGLRPSEGMALTVQQRLLDLVVLGCLAVLAGAGLIGSDAARLSLMALGAALALVALAAVLSLPDLLATGVALIRGTRFAERTRIRKLLLGMLRGRRWMSSIGATNRILPLMALTSAEWAANIAAIALVMHATLTDLPVIVSVAIAVGVVLASAIPLQAVGGIGIAELAMTGALVAAGAGIDAAVTAALLMRALLIGVPVALWALTLLDLGTSARQPHGC